MKKIGFTGTQIGMTAHQRLVLGIFLRHWRRNGLDEIEFHHGDCIGADADADKIARSLGCKIHIHPPRSSQKRAFCEKPGDVIYDQKEYLERNHDIVDAVELMFATPKEREEQLRSGTWATIRYTRKKKKQLKIIYFDPD